MAGDKIRVDLHTTKFPSARLLVTMALHVSPQVMCPPKAVDGYMSPGDRVPYITQLLSPMASPSHLVALCDDGTLHVFDKTQWRAPARTIRSTESEAITSLANLEAVSYTHL